MRPRYVKVIGNGQSEEWDRLVFSETSSGYGHLFNFSRVIEETYGHRPIYLGVFKPTSKGQERLTGLLPLFRFKRIRGRPRLVSVPYFDTAGILARDKRSRTLLLEASCRLCSRNKNAGIELRQNAPLDKAELIIGEAAPQIFTAKTGLVIELPESREKMFAAFKSKLRSQIRKGRKNGLTWKIGKIDLLDEFYAVFSRNMRDLGSPVHSKGFFESFFNYFNDDSFICVVYYRSKPVACSFMFRFKNRISNPWASSIREFRPLNSNVYLYWQMIGFACDLGMAAFDMGRSSVGAPTYRFKKQWGPAENPIFWYGWNFKGNEKDLFNETLSFPPWKKLPLRIANLLGPKLRKHISL